MPHRATIVTGVLLTVTLCAPASGAERWWNLRWPYRREITIAKVLPTHLPGADAAWVTFYTGGQAAEGGKDLRVIAEGGQETPCRIVQSGPADAVTIAFAIVADVQRYWVYFGNPDAPPGRAMTLQRGVLQETWPLPGEARTDRQVAAMLAKAGPPAGRVFQPRLFVGYNPVGPEARIANRLTAWFIVPAAGQYEFVATGNGATFLSIDGKTVHSSPGRNRVQRRFDRGGKMALSAGLHEMIVQHFCTAGAPVVLAAWRVPGNKSFELIPAKAVAPIVSAQAGAMSRYPGAADVDFTIDHANEAFVADRYYQRYVFTATAVGQTSTRQRWQWNFGDGTTGIGQRVEHVFLRDRVYTVTLSGSGPRGPLIRTNRIAVARPWAHVTRRNIDDPTVHGKIVANYDFTAMPTEAVAEAVVLLNASAQHDAMLNAGAALLTANKLSGRAVAESVQIYVEALCDGGNNEQAAAALLKAAAASDAPPLQLLAVVQAARIKLDYLGDVDAAETLLAAAMKDHPRLAPTPIYRSARLAAADVLRARGQAQAARKAYRDLQAPQPPAAAARLRGDLAVRTEDFLRRGELHAARECLQRWQDAFPTDKLEGYWSLLQARWMRARGLPAAAAREAEILVAVSPKSNYAPELLMLAAAAYDSLGDRDRADRARKRLIREYPESPLAAEAAAGTKAKP